MTREGAPLQSLSLSSIPPIIKEVRVGHPLNGGSHELHVSVYDPVRVHIGDLDGLPDLALQALGPSPGDRKLDSQRVPMFYILIISLYLLFYITRNLTNSITLFATIRSHQTPCRQDLEDSFH